MVDGLLFWEVARHQSPSVTTSQHVEDGVEDRAGIPFSSGARLEAGEVRLEELPFEVGKSLHSQNRAYPL